MKILCEPLVSIRNYFCSFDGYFTIEIQICWIIQNYNQLIEWIMDDGVYFTSVCPIHSQLRYMYQLIHVHVVSVTITWWYHQLACMQTLAIKNNFVYKIKCFKILTLLLLYMSWNLFSTLKDNLYRQKKNYKNYKH